MSFNFTWLENPKPCRYFRAKTRGLVAFAVLAILCLGPRDAESAIVLDNVTSATVNAELFTIQHTTGAGLDRIMVVCVSVYSANKPVLNMSYGGVPLTLLGAIDGGSGSDNRRTEIWYLVAPAAGTAPLDVTMSGGSKFALGILTYFGVDPLAPVSGFFSAEGSGTAASVSVASGLGEVVIDCITTKGSADPIAPGAGQTELWNEPARPNRGNVLGGGSRAMGAAMTTMSWTLGVSEYWVLGATSLLPAPPRPYLVDAMVKLSTEPDAAYLTDGVYETTASLQSVGGGALNGATVEYNVRLENDGLNPDRFTITGTAPDPQFDVQYLDGSGIDRTAEVTAGGYLDLILAPGGSTVWTIIVTPALSAPGGTSFPVALTASSSGDPLLADQVVAVTVSMSPLLSMSKTVDLANAAPGQDLTYTIVATTAPGLGDATALVLVDPVPADIGLQVGSVNFDPGTTGLTATVQYSNDNGGTWTYVPGSGACGAPLSYDYCVTHVRWELAGVMPADESFTISFTGRVR